MRYFVWMMGICYLGIFSKAKFKKIIHTVHRLNTKFNIMGKFHDFGKIQFRWSPPKLSLNWETENLPI